METLIKQIKVTEYIDLLLYEGTDTIGGCYISIKHSAKVRNMEGEVIIIPSEVPQLMQALATASIELTARGYFNEGFCTASAKKKPDSGDYILGYHATELGAKELEMASENRKKRRAEIKAMNLDSE